MNNFIEIGSSTVIRVNVRLVLQEEKTLNAGAWEPWLQVRTVVVTWTYSHSSSRMADSDERSGATQSTAPSELGM